MLKQWRERYALRGVNGNIFFRFLGYFLGTFAPFSPKVFGGTILGKHLEITRVEKPTNVLDFCQLTKYTTRNSPVVLEKKNIAINPFVILGGVRYLALDDINKSLRCSVLSDNGKGSVIITKGGATVQLTAGQDYIHYQSTKIYLLHGLKFGFRGVLVSYDDYLKVLVPLLAINLITEKTPALKTIVLDPGHGGKDPGAINTRLNISEKVLTLSLAMSLKSKLNEKGYTIILTRDSDRFVELRDRPTKARNMDLFVSLHINSATNSSAQGIEIFTLRRGKFFSGNAFDPWNLIAAYSVLSVLVEATGFTNRGIKMAEFAVLKPLTCPGILVELGFISNDAEARKLTDANSQKKIIQGLVDGIVKYGENLKKMSKGLRPLDFRKESRIP
ncbi:MAG: N-acetylmuramoyl-L-alanine amidase [Puniceicoccales bacterium]|jgi:N-acetylmuramoyl-L-alanine amidase|nr:N-acetylmuramoyl-L-alanine amidase [Puniceicoccales bacterium]